jgi:hypothetical protein
MEDNALTVFIEKASTLLDRWRVRRTARVLSVFFAAEHALHSHPMADDDVFRVNPLEIREAVPIEQFFQLFLAAHSNQPHVQYPRSWEAA